MNIGPIGYATDGAPDAYRCATCDTHGVKLWRLSNTFLEHQRLACCDCAAANEEDISDIDASGKYTVREHGYRIDQINGMVPAVPTEDGSTFWGYSSVPDGGVAWWKRLPTRLPVGADHAAT